METKDVDARIQTGSASDSLTAPTAEQRGIDAFDRVDAVTTTVLHEVLRAMGKFLPFNSAHEGYAVLREEVDELWDEVKKNQRVRDKSHMRKEAIQCAAMAVRFVLDVCDQTRPDDAQPAKAEGR